MKGVLQCWGMLNRFFKMSLVHGEGVDEIDLVAGSHQISCAVRAGSGLGQKDKYPERLLGTTWGAFQQLDDGAVANMKESFSMLVGEKDASECRFIKLQKGKK
jgi:hypothetical protein